MEQKIAIPWWKSKIILGAAVSIVTKVLVLTGLLHGIDPGIADHITDALVLIAGGVGDIVALSARVTQTQAPVITSSRSKASAITERVQDVAEELALDVADEVLDGKVPSWMLR